MSVGKVCDAGYTCLFMQNGACVLDQSKTEVCRFVRKGGLYVADMKLKKPEPFTRQAP